MSTNNLRLEFWRKFAIVDQWKNHYPLRWIGEAPINVFIAWLCVNGCTVFCRDSDILVMGINICEKN